MSEENKTSMKDFFSSPEYKELTENIKKATLEEEKANNEFWENLSYDDQLKAFYSVIKRLVQGELKDHGTYRWVLYDVFNFGPESYGIGMDCGYMELHNAIYTSKDLHLWAKSNGYTKNES